MEEVKNGHKIFFENPEAKRLFRRPRYTLEDNIKLDLRVVGMDGVFDSSGSGQGPMACCGEYGDKY